MEEKKVMRTLTRTKWGELTRAFEDACKRIGATSPVRMHFEELSPDEFRITNLRTGKRVCLKYDDNVRHINFETPSVMGHFVLHLGADGRSIQMLDEGIPKFNGELIRKILKLIVG